MSSEVKANKLSPATGTDVVLGDASDTFTIPASATLDVSSATMTGFTIPSGQTLTVASSGEIDIASGATITNSGTASGFGLFTSYAIIADHKDDTTNGGTFTSGDWRTRDLQTEVADPDGIVSISSDQFTLGAGSYLIRWTCPAWTVSRHKSRLYNVTDTVAEGYGQSIVALNPGANSDGSARVVITGSTVFEIQHRCETTRADDGFGVQSGFGVIEVYTIVEIYKEA